MQVHPTNIPFLSFTRKMVIELENHVVILLNASPPKSRLSKTYSPRTKMTVKDLDWKIICRLHFEAYARVQKDRTITNTLEDITQGPICLGPTGNLQVNYNFFLIRTIKKNPWTIHRGVHTHNLYEIGGGNGPNRKT